MAHRPVVGGDDVLDLVGQERRRIDVARRRGAEQQRDLAPVADRLVGEEPDARPSPGRRRSSSRWRDRRIDLERPPERPEHVDRVAGPEAGEPLRPAADRPEVDRDHPRRRVGGVDRERPPEHEPGQSPVRTWTNWPGPRAVRELRRVERLEPLARAGSPGSRRARSGRAASSRAGVVLLGRRAGLLGLVRRLDVAVVLGSPSSSSSESSSPEASAPCRRRPRPRSSSSGAIDGIGLGERVGEVAEHVGRVVVLDELLGASRAAATRSPPRSGPRPGTRRRRSG